MSKRRSKKLIAEEIALWQTMHAVAPVKCIDVVLRVLMEDIDKEDLEEELDMILDDGVSERKLEEAYEIARHTWGWVHSEEKMKPSERWSAIVKERTGDFDFSKHRR
jgi:hypothetical protein